MQFKKLFPMLIAIIIIAIGITACDGFKQTTSSEQPTFEEQNDDFISIRFTDPMSIDQLIVLCDEHQLSVEEIRIEMGNITCGYTVAGREMSSIRENFDFEHQKFLDAMQDFMQLEDSLDQNRSVQAELLLDIQELEQTSDLSIDIVTFRGISDNVPIAQLNAEIVEDIVVFPLDRELDENLIEEDIPDSLIEMPNSSWHERWAPYGGYSVITRNYTYQRFIFNNVSDYSYNRTYEHETQIYDRNYANYGGYWSSNLPTAYKDTQYGDNIDNFTVGTSRARNLVAYWWYYTYMSLSPQSSSTALCRIKGQIGHRWPTECYSTWCIWPDATSGSMAYLALPNYGVCWQY